MRILTSVLVLSAFTLASAEASLTRLECSIMAPEKYASSIGNTYAAVVESSPLHGTLTLKHANRGSLDSDSETRYQEVVFSPKSEGKGFEGSWRSHRNSVTLDVSAPSSIPRHWKYDGFLVIDETYSYPVKCGPTR